MTQAEQGPDQRKVMQLYAAFGAALLLSVVPFILAAFTSAVLFMGVLIAAHILRAGTEHGSLLENHMTFVIRTIWIGSFLALITMSAASFYLFDRIDHTPLDPCIRSFLSVGQGAFTLDPQALMNIFKGCFHNYIAVNFQTFLISGLIAAVPILLYFIIRYARGLARAAGGYRIAHPEKWL